MSAALRLAALAGWTALLASWALIFVPALFSHIPSTSQVAELVGATLVRVNQVGAALAAVAVTCAVRLPRGGARSRAFAWLPLVGVAAHLASWLWIAPETRAIREAAGGSVGLLPAGDPRVQRFQTLHTVSFGVYVGVALIALACCANALVELAAAARLRAQKVRSS